MDSSLHSLNLHQAGTTYFVVQNEDTIAGCFFDNACCHYYISRLLNSLKTYRVNLHAYCVLPNRVLFLFTPETPTGIHRLIGAVMSQYREYYKHRFERSAEKLGRNIKSLPLDAGQSILQCQISIEQQPLIEGLSEHAAMYPWSSYSSNGFGVRDRHLRHHREFDQFLRNTPQPHEHYHKLVKAFNSVPLTP